MLTLRTPFLSVVLVALIACVPVFAQESASTGLFSPDHNIEEEEVYDLIQAYQLVRLKKVLGLDDTETLELVTHIGTYKDDLTKQRIYRAILREQLRNLLAENADESVILDSLQRQIQHEENLVGTLRAMVDKADASLSSGQRARLYLFVDDFEREITEMAEKAQAMHQRGEGIRSIKSDTSPEGGPMSEEESDALRSLVTVETRKLDIADEEHDDIIELVDAWMMVRMANELELNTQETVRLFQHVGTYKDQLHQMKWQIGSARSELRVSIDNESDDVIERQLEDLLLQEEAVADLVRVFITEARKDVSTVQAARLYLFLIDFENEVVGLIARANQIISAQ